MNNLTIRITLLTVMISLLHVQGYYATSRSTQQNNWQKMTVLATAYCPCRKCCGKHADGVTAIGRSAYKKGIAVDKKRIPLRSIVKVPGYGVVVADDVGGAIKKNRIDVRFPTHQAALNWGRKKITIYYQSR